MRSIELPACDVPASYLGGDVQAVLYGRPDVPKRKSSAARIKGGESRSRSGRVVTRTADGTVRVSGVDDSIAAWFIEVAGVAVPHGIARTRTEPATEKGFPVMTHGARPAPAPAKVVRDVDTSKIVRTPAGLIRAVHALAVAMSAGDVVAAIEANHAILRESGVNALARPDVLKRLDGVAALGKRPAAIRCEAVAHMLTA